MSNQEDNFDENIVGQTCPDCGSFKVAFLFVSYEDCGSYLQEDLAYQCEDCGVRFYVPHGEIDLPEDIDLNFNNE